MQQDSFTGRCPSSGYTSAHRSRCNYISRTLSYLLGPHCGHHPLLLCPHFLSSVCFFREKAACTTYSSQEGSAAAHCNTPVTSRSGHVPMSAAAASRPDYDTVSKIRRSGRVMALKAGRPQVWLTGTSILGFLSSLGRTARSSELDQERWLYTPFQFSRSPRLPCWRAVCLMQVLIYKLSSLLPQIVV